MTKSKKAFTLLELIFVIVVLGIVLSIVAEILAKMYGGYITARTSERLQSKTELAAQQIANRLSYKISPTVIAKDSATNSFVSLRNSDGTQDILEWIGRDFVSFRGSWDAASTLHQPLWSGFIDIEHNSSTRHQFITPASKPQSLSASISTQSFGSVDLDPLSTNKKPAVIFKGRMDDFNISRYYLQANSSNFFEHYVYPIECVATGCDDANPVLVFVNDYDDNNSATADVTLYEQYYLTWSAYALVPNTTNNTLELYYNYQPWEGESYSDGDSSVLVDDLQTFRFTQVGEVIRIKVCASENDGGGFSNDEGNLTVCKEKAVL